MKRQHLTSGEPALRIDSLSIRYPGRHTPVVAVDNVSLTVAPGQCVGLVGESGSGKTTIGLAAQGLLTRSTGVDSTGSITVAGVRLNPVDEAGWSDIRGSSVTTVFQDPSNSLDPTMTIGRALNFVTGSKSDTANWLAAVEIRDPAAVMRSYPHQLSGGMCQRVMIALALARRPDLLIADEPTTALDVSVQAQILKLLSRERETLGCAVLFITHDLGVARTMCDDIMVLRNGQEVEFGTAEAVFTSPKADYTRRLMASRLTLNSDTSRPLGMPEPTVATAMVESLGGAAAGHTVDQVTKRWTSGAITWQDFVSEPRAPRRPPVLELAKVSKSFRTGGMYRSTTKSVLHGVDLRIGYREGVALVGESGSGKTTIMRIAAGLESPDEGDVVVDQRAGAGVQVIPQNAGASLTPWHTVEQLLTERLVNSAEGRALDSKTRRRRVHQALDRVALSPSVLSYRADQLSGGQRQRVAIARATIVPPALLLCDEPTSALDVSVACTVLNLLNLLRHDLGLSLLFVTHDLSAARIAADRVAVINDGTIVEEVPADRLDGALTSEYGRKLLDAILV